MTHPEEFKQIIHILNDISTTLHSIENKLLIQKPSPPKQFKRKKAV